MKLLLDEMLPQAIAEQLRARGHDVVAVTERADLRGVADAELFRRAQEERRAVVTYNRDDFLMLTREHTAAGRAHAGLVIVHPQRFPQVRAATIGRLVRGLDTFVHAGPPYPNFVHWLE